MLSYIKNIIINLLGEGEQRPSTLSAMSLYNDAPKLVS